MKILIRVTKAILKKSMMCGQDGVEGSVAENCAIALAAQEFFPMCVVSYDDDIEGTPTIFHYPNAGPTSIKMPLPKEAFRFMSNFDNSSPEERLLMPEHSFEITVPRSIIDEIGIGQVYKILSESKTLELVHP